MKMKDEKGNLVELKVGDKIIRKNSRKDIDPKFFIYEVTALNNWLFNTKLKDHNGQIFRDLTDEFICDNFEVLVFEKLRLINGDLT